jgi:hypothetical protein
MQVTIDSNDSSQLPNLAVDLGIALNSAVTIRPLGESSGDLRVELDDGRVAVFERKETPSDLLASIADKRLFEQSDKIPTIADWGILVMVGKLSYTHDDYVLSWRGGHFGPTGWKRQAVEAALNRASLNGMIVLRDCKDYVSTVQSVIDDCLHGHIHMSRKAVGVNPFDDDKQRAVGFIGQLPGVGKSRASSLYDWLETRLGRAPEIELLLQSATWAGYHPNGPDMWGLKTSDGVKGFLYGEKEDLE